MSYKINVTKEFAKEIKRLSTKYPSIRKDFQHFLESIEMNPFQGTPLGNSCYKVRMAISSKSKGKSGGARVITYVHITMEAVILISIYDKSELSTISDKEIKEPLNAI
jgi:mRNA-degrading endonuclease RelE of RelBE toxin-antitoxin system